MPFAIARTGRRTTEPRTVTAPTSHVDLVPTLLAAAGVDTESVAAQLAERFTEVHPLPGRNLLPVVDGAPPDEGRVVYLQTRGNIFEGDVLATAAASKLGFEHDPPPVLRAAVPAGVGTAVEGIVGRVDDSVPGWGGHLWKLVRTFDDPATWTEPHVRQLDRTGYLGDTYRTTPLDDQWEFYDLDEDSTESRNRWTDPELSELRDHLVGELDRQRNRCIPSRHTPWPYVAREPRGGIPWPGDDVGRVLGRRRARRVDS